MAQRNRAANLALALTASLLLLASVSGCNEAERDAELDGGSSTEADAQAVQASDAATARDAAGNSARTDASADSRADASTGLDASNAAADASAPNVDASSPADAGRKPDAATADAQVSKPDAATPDAQVSKPDASGNDAQVSKPDAQSGPILGVYCGNSVEGIKQFESWLGRPVDGVLGYTGNASWEDYDGSVGWAVGLWSALDRRVLWSVPLIANGASLAQAGMGAYDEHYRKAAQTLATYRPQDGQLYIRTGWEFNGNWFPWTTHGGKSADFVAAFRRFVTVFRSVSNRFVFEWNVNVGDVGMNPEEAYPGDAYVDIIGMDFYWNTQFMGTDPQAAWTQMVNQRWGLKWHQDFAKAHKKPTAYSEWGIKSNEAAYYIQQAKAWFASHPVLYQTYWNADNEYPGKLSSGQYPSSGAAYKTAFGR